MTSSQSQIESWLCGVDAPGEGELRVSSQTLQEDRIAPKGVVVTVVTHSMDLLSTTVSRPARTALEERGEVISWHGGSCIHPRAILATRACGAPVWLVWRNRYHPSVIPKSTSLVNGAEPVLAQPTEASPNQSLPVLILDETTTVEPVEKVRASEVRVQSDPHDGLKVGSDADSTTQQKGKRRRRGGGAAKKRRKVE